VAGMQRPISAMVAGRKRWLERAKAAKAAGLIDKIPTGRRRPVVRRAADRKIARARGLLFEIALRKLGPPASTAPKPWAEQSLAEQSATITDLALARLREILDFDVSMSAVAEDPVRLKLLGFQKDAARVILALHVKELGQETRLR